MRVPQPFFRKQTGSWYVQIRGKQHPLGKDQEAAWTEYHRLMSGQREAAPSTPAAVVIDQFLEWVSVNQAKGTYQFYGRHLKRFATYIGAKRKVSDLKPYHVTRWVDRDYADQSDTSKFAAYRSVERVFNWAKKQGIISTSPVENLDKPTPGRRETYLTPEQYVEVVKLVEAMGAKRKKKGYQRPFLDLLAALWDLGCRPQEVRLVEARHFDEKRGVWIFERKQSKGKKRRRVIYLTDRVREISKRLSAEFPSGPIFRNTKKLPWTKDSLNCRFRGLQKKLPFPIHAYCFRHGFTTDKLKRGIDSTTVAGLLGNTTTRMLETVYQHVEADDAYMRRALNGTSA